MENKDAIRNLTVGQLASKLSYSKVWIRRLAREQRIPSTKVGFGRGRMYKFNESEVRKHLDIDNGII